MKLNSKPVQVKKIENKLIELNGAPHMHGPAGPMHHNNQAVNVFWLLTGWYIEHQLSELINRHSSRSHFPPVRTLSCVSNLHKSIDDYVWSQMSSRHL